jgi:quinol monooxygenase YgiN
MFPDCLKTCKLMLRRKSSKANLTHHPRRPPATSPCEPEGVLRDVTKPKTDIFRLPRQICQLSNHHLRFHSHAHARMSSSPASACSAFATGQAGSSRRIKRDSHIKSSSRVVAARTINVVAANDGDGRKSLFVKVTVKDGCMAQYKEVIERHITNCFANDRCMYFDYGFSQEDANVVMLYETYEDALAMAEHKASMHLKEYLEKAAPLTHAHDVSSIDLAKYGSVNCNYAGECELGDGIWD